MPEIARPVAETTAPAAADAGIKTPSSTPPTSADSGFPEPVGEASDASGASATMPAMPLSRIAWLTVVAICVIAAVLLLVSDYYGYAGVLAAVGLSAAINLR
jgi:hypothetical protein